MGLFSTPKYDWSKANVAAPQVQWNPYSGGALQYSTTPQLASSMANIGNAVSSTPAGNQYLTQGRNEVNRILSEGYQAMSPDYMTKKYESVKGNLQKDFGKQENQIASRLANQGLTGSGISTADWGDQANNEKQILANVWQQLQDTNEQQTQANKQNALRMTPQLTQLSAQLSQQPLQNQLQYNTILQQQNAAKNQIDEYNNRQKYDQWGQQLELNKTNASNQLQANAANAQAYQNWYNQATASKNAQLGMLGGALGSAASGFLAPLGMTYGKRLWG